MTGLTKFFPIVSYYSQIIKKTGSSEDLNILFNAVFCQGNNTVKLFSLAHITIV